MDWLIENWDRVLQLAMQAVGAAAMLAAMTPTPKDDNMVKKAKKLLDVVGANFWHAKNAEDK